MNPLRDAICVRRKLFLGFKYKASLTCPMEVHTRHMQATAELGVLQEAAPAEAAGVADHGFSAFLTGVAALWEETAQIEELHVKLSERLIRVMGIDRWVERCPESQAEIEAEAEAELQQMAVLLASASASAAELDSLNPETSDTSSSDEEEDSDEEYERRAQRAEVPTGMVAALHLFHKSRCRIRFFSAHHDSLGAAISLIKAQGEAMQQLCLGLSAEEKQEMIKQVKLRFSQQQADLMGLVTYRGTCRSLSDTPLHTGFKSASPDMNFERWNIVSPVLRPRVFVHKFVDAAARLCSTEDYAGAVVQYMRAVHAYGHLPSMAPLAWILMYGRRGVLQDYLQAAQLVAKGDLQGCTHCAGVLSLCLLQGRGVTRDVERAWQLARTSAAAGSSYGQFALGTLLHEISENKVEALAQHQLSAAQGLDAAQYALGVRHHTGDGVPADNEEALRLYQLAAAQGFPEAFAAIADHAGGDEKMRLHWLLRSYLAGGNSGQRSLLALGSYGGYYKAREHLDRLTSLSGIKQTKQVDEEGGDGGLCKSGKTDEE